MSGTIHHKLHSIEIPPPPGHWDQLARRLDEEFDASELQTGALLFDLEAEPPAKAWSFIALGLEEKAAAPRVPAKLVILRRLAAAAVLLAAVLVTGYFIFRTQPPIPENAGLAETNLPAAPVTGSPDSSPPVTAGLASALVNGFRHIKSPESLPDASAAEVAATTDSELEATENGHMHAADVLMLQPIEAGINAEIKAPPIRDRQGRLIMDRRTLAPRGANYISVTAPNGQQTRISSKFLSVITYLNEERPIEYFDVLIDGSSSWKSKFQQWRNRLVDAVNYAPSGGNFMDIFELQSLLLEED